MKRWFLTFIATVLLLPGLFTGPAAADWTPVGPHGGAVDTIAAAPSRPSLLYAALASGHVFKSLDQGRSWVHASSFAPDHLFFHLEVDPLQPSRVFAARSDGLFRSTDGAATWVRIEPDLEPPGPTPALALAVHTRRPAHLLASFTYGGRLYRSADRGRTWQPVESLPTTDVRFIETVPAEPDTFWVAAWPNRIFRSTDGGRRWTAANRGLSARGRIQSFAVDPRSPRTAYASLYFTQERTFGFYKTTNGGSTWKRLRASLATELAVDPARPFVYAVFEDGNLYRSPNGGARWTRAETGLRGQIRHLEATRSGLLAATSTGVFRSTDQAASWQEANRGISGVSVSGLAIDGQNPPRLYAGDPVSGVFKSRNRGASWLSLGDPDPENLVPWDRPLAVSPAEPEVVYAGVTGAVAKSTNGGRRWTLHGPLPCLVASRLLIDPREASTLYAVGGFYTSGCGLQPDACTLFRSLDAGETWECTGRSQPGRTGAGLLGVDPLTSAVYAVTYPGNVWRSTDRGDTWTLIHSGSRLFSSFVASPLVEGTYYGGAQGEVGRSRDSGQTWEYFSAGLPEEIYVTALALDPTDPDIVYAVAAPRVYRSTDGGETWAPLGDWPEGFQATPNLVVDPVDPSIIYVGTTTNGVLRYEP